METQSEIETEKERSLQRWVRRLESENETLRENIKSVRRMFAAAVIQAGGEIRIDERTIEEVELYPQLELWTENFTRQVHVRILEEANPPNESSSATARAGEDSR